MMVFMKRLVVLFGVAASLLTLLLPALAQGPGEFDYRVEDLGLLETGPNELLYVVAPDRAGLRLGEGKDLTLTGIANCVTEDPKCLTGGLDGQPLVLSVTGFRVEMEDIIISSFATQTFG
jgi:hypothetical protein